MTLFENDLQNMLVIFGKDKYTVFIVFSINVWFHKLPNILL